MTPISIWKAATDDPDAIAVIDAAGQRCTRGALHARANQLVRALRTCGVGPGDAVAFVLPNGLPVIELFCAVHQMGARIVPINHHLAAPEIAWILADCGAKLVVAHHDQAEVIGPATAEVPHRVAVGPIEGFVPYTEFGAGLATDPPRDRLAGTTMTYTSGTTGRPKGVARPLGTSSPEEVSTPQAMFLGLFGIFPGSPGVHLVVAPLYHTAVLNFATNHLHLGHTLVLMDKWTPEGMLERVARHRVTSTHCVPTHLIRLLKLPAAVRAAADTSSLTHVIHSAAPCPVDVKAAMLDWWGDCIYEYYAASEGGGTLATPQDWRAHPGTVGKGWPISTLQIRDLDGATLPPDSPGTVWIRMGTHRFRYHQDDEKTEDAWADDFFTVGDVGWLDAEGFLFLGAREGDLILSGGVNVYPAEIEAVLLACPELYDAAVLGLPDDDWGERIHAVVEPAPGVSADGIEARLVAWCDGKLARFKTPRSWTVVAALPRDENGKVVRKKLREAAGA